MRRRSIAARRTSSRRQTVRLPGGPARHGRCGLQAGPGRHRTVRATDAPRQPRRFHRRARRPAPWAGRRRRAGGTESERLAPPVGPHYDSAAIAERLDELAALDEVWTGWFAREGVTPLRITYDALASDPHGTLARIPSALGLDPESAASVGGPTAKLAWVIDREWRKRFVAERVRGRDVLKVWSAKRGTSLQLCLGPRRADCVAGELFPSSRRDRNRRRERDRRDRPRGIGACAGRAGRSRAAGRPGVPSSARPAHRV